MPFSSPPASVILTQVILGACICAKSVQSCWSALHPWDQTGTYRSSVHKILQTRILEGVATVSSMVLSHPGIKPASPVASALQADPLHCWATKEAPMLGTLALNYYSLYNATFRIRFYALLGRLINQKMCGL